MDHSPFVSPIPAAQAAGAPLDLLFDWKLDVDRFAAAAARAKAAGEADPWLVVEAECAIELIDAEMLALKRKPQDDESVRASMRQLTLWRSQIALAKRTLEALAQPRAKPAA